MATAHLNQGSMSTNVEANQHRTSDHGRGPGRGVEQVVKKWNEISSDLEQGGGAEHEQGDVGAQPFESPG